MEEIKESLEQTIIKLLPTLLRNGSYRTPEGTIHSFIGTTLDTLAQGLYRKPNRLQLEQITQALKLLEDNGRIVLFIVGEDLVIEYNEPSRPKVDLVARYQQLQAERAANGLVGIPEDTDSDRQRLLDLIDL
jgi:hypothetical protein